MFVVTKKGDRGMTDVKGGRVGKDSELIEVMGNLDELLAVLGIVMTEKTELEKSKIIEAINRDLYMMMGQLSGFGKKINWKERIDKMENDISKIDREKDEVKEFLRVGSELDVWLNWARTVCRRCERRLVKYNKGGQEVDLSILKYINRLSDYLFMLARRPIKKERNG